MMNGNPLLRRYGRYEPHLRAYTQQVTPARTPMPLLGRNTYNTVSNLLNSTGRTMAGLKKYEWGLYSDYTSIWRALGSNQNRWRPEIQSVWQKRTDAMKLVAGEIDRLPLFQGLDLANRFHYKPWDPKLARGIGAQTDMATGIVTMGSGPFELPSFLVRGMLHEGRHVWQAIQASKAIKKGKAHFVPHYLERTALKEADAYLFSLVHRHLYGARPEMVKHDIAWFRGYCDMNDRLAAGLRVDAKFHVSQIMDPVKRSELELRYSFIESAVRRDLRGPDYTSFLSRLPKTFSYKPWYQKSYYESGSSFFRDLWRWGNRPHNPAAYQAFR